MQGGPLKVLHPELWLGLLWTAAGGREQDQGQRDQQGVCAQVGWGCAQRRTCWAWALDALQGEEEGWVQEAGHPSRAPAAGRPLNKCCPQGSDLTHHYIHRQVPQSRRQLDPGERFSGRPQSVRPFEFITAGPSRRLSPPSGDSRVEGCGEDDLRFGSWNCCFPGNTEPPVHEGEPAALQEQNTTSSLSVQSQDLIFNFQKHEWSDHGWKIETILRAPPSSPGALAGCEWDGAGTGLGITASLLASRGLASPLGLHPRTPTPPQPPSAVRPRGRSRAPRSLSFLQRQQSWCEEPMRCARSNEMRAQVQ